MEKKIKLPFAIADADGRILYKSRAVKTAGFLPVIEKVLASGKRKGLVICNGKSCYISSVLLYGKEYIIYTECGKIGESLDTYFMEICDELFDIKAIAADKRNITLATLTGIFTDACRTALGDEGVRISVNKMARDIPICVSPRAFVLALAVLARIAATDGDVVDFSVKYEYGKVMLTCNSVGGKKYKPQSKEMLEILLYETSLAGGFEVERVVLDGKAGYMLCLVPTDVTFVGFKVAVSEKERSIYAAYISMFL